jgi:hypothetical protein
VLARAQFQKLGRAIQPLKPASRDRSRKAGGGADRFDIAGRQTRSGRSIVYASTGILPLVASRQDAVSNVRCRSLVYPAHSEKFTAFRPSFTV